MIFFALFFLFFAGATAYVLCRLWQMIPASAPTLRVVAVVLGVALTAAFIAGMAARSGGIPVWLVSLMHRAGSTWMFVLLYLLMIFLAGDLLRAVHLVPRSVMAGNWWSLGSLTLVLALVFTLGNLNYHHKRRAEIALRAAVDRPVKIVAASDLHLGFGTGRREFARWVDMINREKPDAVIFVGDVIDTGTRPLWQGDFAAEFRRLDAPWGVFAVPGNHEYIAGIDESLRFLEHAGVRVLRDSVAVIAGGLCIAGRDDASNRGRKTVAALVHSVLDGQTTILADHQPHRLEEAAEAGVDLQISGHTHRGQVWPATWITDAMFECSHGRMTKGATQYYISQGLGIWGGKFRIGSRSEYLVVNVTPAGR